MGASYDSSNLMYVTKEYENEVKAKIAKIYESGDVNQVIDNVDMQLNSILDEINSKLQFVNEKVADATTYRIGVHTQIDETKVNVNDLVADGINETTAHPSTIAFKPDRSYTKYETYDFINKALSFGNKDFVKLNGLNETGDEKVHTFTINHNIEEYMKIVEFAFTYKQFPTVLTKNVDGTINDESTVTVTRVFRGRFFILWADPKLEPGKFIVKAIVENADNTGNIIDKKILDVKNRDENGSYSVIMDEGPQFDLYFHADGDTISISIGKITPYRWLIRKEYVSSGETKDINFTIEKAVTNGKWVPTEFYYSKTAKTYILVDKTNNKIGYALEGSDFNNAVIFDSTTPISYTDDELKNVMYKEIGTKSFLTINDNSYLFLTDISSIIKLDKKVVSVFGLSTGEIICYTEGELRYFDSNSNTILGKRFVEFNSDIDTSVDILEKDNYAIVFFSSSEGVFYKLLEKSGVDGKFDTSTKTYAVSRINDFVVRSNIESSKIKAINTPYGINVVYTENDIESQVATLNTLKILGNIATFNEVTKLQVYDYINGTFENETLNISKLVHTSLFNFVITADKKLYIIDDERIVNPLHFIEKRDEEGNLLGYSDESGMFFMPPEDNEESLFVSDNPYLQNVVDVCETSDGVYIFDEDGIYLLNSDKSLKAVFYTDNARLTHFLQYCTNDDSYGLISCVNNSEIISTFYKLDYTKQYIPSKKLKNTYVDLFSQNYELAKDDYSENNFDNTVVDFYSKLYVTLVDHLSVIYNTDQNVQMQYDNTLKISDIETSIHKEFQRFDENNLSHTYTKEFIPVMYSLKPNKYGFKMYKDILTHKSSAQFSNINSLKKYIIRRPKDSNITLEDVEKAIYKFLDEKFNELIGDNVTVDKDIIEYMTINPKQWYAVAPKRSSAGYYPTMPAKYLGSYKGPLGMDNLGFGNDSVGNYEFGSSIKNIHTPVGEFQLAKTTLYIDDDYDIFNSDYGLLKDSPIINHYETTSNENESPVDNVFIDYIHNTEKMVVMAGGKRNIPENALYVFKCYDPTTDEFVRPFYDDRTDRLTTFPGLDRFKIIDDVIYAWSTSELGNKNFTIINPDNLANPKVITIPSTSDCRVLDISKVDGQIFITIATATIINQYVYNPSTEILTDKYLNFTNYSGRIFAFDSKMYEFSSEYIYKLSFEKGFPGLLLLKYNKASKKFEPIYSWNNAVVNELIVDCELFEITNRIFGVVYDSQGNKLTNIGDVRNMSELGSIRLPPLFEYLPKENVFKAWCTDRAITTRGWYNNNRIKWYYNVPQIISRESVANDYTTRVQSIHNLPENKMLAIIPDDTIKSQLIQDGYEYIFEESTDANKCFKIKARNIKTGNENYILTDDVLWKRNLSGAYHFKTKDTEPQNGKVYYTLNQQGSHFVAQSGSISNLRSVNTFVRKEISDNLVKVDINVQTAPIIGSVYYTRDVYGNYTEHVGLTSFESGEVYYEKTYDYSHFDGSSNVDYVYVADKLDWKLFEGSTFEENTTYYEAVYLYDSAHDSEATNQDSSKLINITKHDYAIDFALSKITLHINVTCQIPNELWGDENNNLTHFEFIVPFDKNEILEPSMIYGVTDKVNDNVIFETGNLKFELNVFSSIINVWKDGMNIASKQIDVKFNSNVLKELNYPICFARENFVYFFGTNTTENMFDVIKYDITTNTFIELDPLPGYANSRMYNTEFGMYIVLESKTANGNHDGFDVYKLTDNDTYEHIYKSTYSSNGYEHFVNAFKLTNPEGYSEIFIFGVTNTNFVRCYKICRDDFTSVELPKEIIQYHYFNSPSETPRPVFNDYAVSMNNSVIWYPDTNKVILLARRPEIFDEDDITASFIKLETSNGYQYHSFGMEPNGGVKIDNVCLTDPGVGIIRMDQIVKDSSGNISVQDFVPLELPVECEVANEYGLSVKQLPEVVEESGITTHNIKNFVLHPMDSVNRQLPIIGPDNVLYFTNARVNKSTGYPDYNSQYEIIDQASNEVIEKNVNFDQICFNSGMLFGFKKSTKSIYVNKHYSTSNSFVKIFTDTSGEALFTDSRANALYNNDSLGLFYMNTKQIYRYSKDDDTFISLNDDIFVPDTFIALQNGAGLITEVYALSNDYQLVIHNSTGFWRYHKSTGKFNLVKATANSDTQIYIVSHGVFLTSYTEEAYTYISNDISSTTIVRQFPTNYICRNDTSKTFDFVGQINIYSYYILELDSGVTVLINNKSFRDHVLIWESIDSTGYEFVAYYFPDLLNGSGSTDDLNYNILSPNFWPIKLSSIDIVKVSLFDGYYKLIHKFPKEADLPDLGIMDKTYKDIITSAGIKFILQFSNNKVVLMLDYSIIILESKDDKIDLKHIHAKLADNGYLYLISTNLSYNKNCINAVEYNGIIYARSIYENTNLMIFGTDYVLTKIENTQSDNTESSKKQIGFNVSFISSSDQIYEKSLADKLFIKLSGTYRKDSVNNKYLENMKALVVDNYINSNVNYQQIFNKDVLSSRYPSVFEHSRDLKDLSIKKSLTNDHRMLTNITNDPDWDKTFEINMEVYPAEVSDVKSIEIREPLTTKGLVRDTGYVVCEKRTHRHPFVPFKKFD